HGFCLRTNRAESVKPQKREYVYVRGGVNIEFLVSQPATDEDEAFNGTENDKRRIVGHRYRFMFYAKRDTIHQHAQAAYNKKAGHPVGTPVNFTPDDSVRRWDPMDEAIRLAVADNAELCKKIQQIHNKPTSARGANAHVGSLAHNKDVLTLPAYSFIKHTRIDQFYANGIVRYVTMTTIVFRLIINSELLLIFLRLVIFGSMTLYLTMLIMSKTVASTIPVPLPM